MLCTAPSQEAALELSRTLVAERLVACVNVVPGLVSVYRWEGAVQEDAEVLLVLKTTAARLSELEARLMALHPYDTPEFVALAAEHIAPSYAAWLAAETAPGEGPGR